MESEYHLTFVRYLDYSNPVRIQGHTESAPGSWYGDPMYFKQSTVLKWEGEYGGQEMYDHAFTEEWFAPAGVCLSVIRDDRVAGTAWFDPGDDTIFSDEMPGLVFYVFQAAHIDTVLFAPMPTTDVLEHEYASGVWGSVDLWIRIPSMLTATSYSSGLDPDELWSIPLTGDTGE